MNKKKLILIAGYVLGYCSFMIWFAGIEILIKSVFFTALTLAALWCWHFVVDKFIK